MLLKKILEYCNNDYINDEYICKNCNHPKKCPGKCEECLRQIHFKADEAGNRHSYDCKNLMDYYVCKYSFKYTSEMCYAFKEIRELVCKEKNLNVLSIGCGPCTDLFALDCMKKQGTYCYREINYIGIDPLEKWERIHDFIKYNVNDINLCFKYKKIQKILPKLFEKEFRSDIIIMNYLLSDFHKYQGSAEVIDFLNYLVYYIINVSPNAIIIINDINLDCSRGGGRDYYDILFSKLRKYGFNCIRKHFKNNNKMYHFDYGQEYGKNELIFSNEFVSEYDDFNPYRSCASAQIIIYRE